MPPDTEEHKRSAPKAENSNIPPVTDIKDQEIQSTAKKLLQEAGRLKARLDADDARLKEIREQLIPIVTAHELTGLRWSKIGFKYGGFRTRRTLSKEKIVDMMSDVGIPVDRIQDCYSESDAYEDARFVLFES